MSFDLDKFTAEPSVELLNLGKKTDLLNLAKHYKLSEIKSSMRKHEIKNILVQYFVDEEIFNENALSLIVDVQSVSSSKELELKLHIRQLEIQEREKEREWEREEREKEREFQLRMREIEMQERVNQSKQKIEYNFDVTKHIRLVPPFQEKEVDKYFLHFEKVAENLNWPKEHWTLLLQSVLIGKAREIYIQLGVEQSQHYETVKELILKGYELVPEAYRQKFRNCKKDSNQTHVEFARNKEQLFDRWCCSKKIDQNYDKLRQLVLVEEFKRCIQSDVKTFLDEKQVETLEEAARLADDYYLTHKVSFIAKPKPTSSHPQNKFMSGNPSGMPSQSNTPKPNSTSETKSQYPLSRPTCNYCKKPGHLVSECLKLKRKLESDEAKPTGLTTLRPRPQSSIKTNTVDIVTKPKSDSTMEIFEPFMLNGFVSLSGDNCPPTPIKILRDTGASQSLILADILPFSEKTSSGTSVLIQGVECGTVNIPLHHVNLSSDLVTGLVVIGITPSLPFKGIHLLLGNDLAGDKVVVNPLVTDTPNIGQTDDPIEQEIPDLYPSCAVTRAMAKKAILKNSNSDIDLTDTFIGQYFDNEIKKSLDPSLSDTKTDSFPIPRIDDCIDKVGNSKYVTKFDLLKGFWQVPLTDRAKEVSAFATPNGLYQYKVMPFGMKNSPATFQRLVNNVICGLDGCDAYIDDVIIYSDSWSDHLQRIMKFFDRLSKAKLTVNLAKTEFCHATVTFLGHLVGQGQVKPLEAKVNAISEFPVPKCKRQLMRFLGMAGYYRKFCKNFSGIAEPLTNLLKKSTKFKWNDKCQDAFDRLKAILKSAPVLLAPDFDKCFKLAVDASDVGIGAVLLQEDNNGIDHPVCYFSKKFNKHQKNYSTIEKECLALILAIQQFEVYLTSSISPIVVFSDHNPLSFLHKLKNKNQRLLRWSLLLQEFNLDIRHIKGKDNIIPDALSRV